MEKSKRRRPPFSPLYTHGPNREEVSKTNTLNCDSIIVNGAALLLSSRCFVRRHYDTDVV